MESKGELKLYVIKKKIKIKQKLVITTLFVALP